MGEESGPDAAAINSAAGLTENLLLVHGSSDDNVHFQGAELLINRPVELGKPFAFMDYPTAPTQLLKGPALAPTSTI
jgi:dipeptidyl-peptidase 4